MKKAAQKFISISDAIIEAIGKTLSWVVVVIMCLMLFEVIMRYCFNAPTHWGSPLCLYLYGASSVLVGGWILKRDKNIRVDLIYVSYPPRFRACCDILAAGFVCFWGYLITKFGWVKFMNAVARHEVSFTSWTIPMWPIRLTIPVAGVILIFAALTKVVGSILEIVDGGKK